LKILDDRLAPVGIRVVYFYRRDSRQQAQRIGIDAIVTPVRSPCANAVVERVIATLRRECLGHLIILAFVSLALVPTVVFYLLAEKQIVTGLTAGAVIG